MLNAQVIYADLPPHVKGMIVKTFDEEECYTVVINSRLNAEQQRAAYYHELKHYGLKDFDKDTSITDMEMLRHYAI